MTSQAQPYVAAPGGHKETAPPRGWWHGVDHHGP